MDELNIPVLLIFFNKYDETLKVLNKIREAKPKKIYLASDGGRNKKEKEYVDKIRRMVDLQIDWQCEIYRKYEENNLGCGEGPISAISWVFEHETKCIILEDDCVPHTSFFYYCQDMLNYYQDEERIWMVSGENYIRNKECFGEYDYTFSLRTETWGWATWKRAWRKCDFAIKNWPNVKKEGLLKKTAYIKCYCDYNYMSKQLDYIYRKKDKSIWDYQWRYSMVLNGGLAIVPRENLVENIGFGKRATHTVGEKPQMYQVSTAALRKSIAKVSYVMENYQFDREYAKIRNINRIKSAIESKNIKLLLDEVREIYGK